MFGEEPRQPLVRIHDLVRLIALLGDLHRLLVGCQRRSRSPSAANASADSTQVDGKSAHRPMLFAIRARAASTRPARASPLAARHAYRLSCRSSIRPTVSATVTACSTRPASASSIGRLSSHSSNQYPQSAQNRANSPGVAKRAASSSASDACAAKTSGSALSQSASAAASSRSRRSATRAGAGTPEGQPGDTPAALPVERPGVGYNSSHDRGHSQP